MPASISKSDFALQLNVSKARISQYVKSGMPVLDSGRIDPGTAVRWLSESRRSLTVKDKGFNRAARKSKTSQADTPVTMDAAILNFEEERTIKEHWLGELRRLEFLQKSGDLISIDEYVKEVVSEYTIIRNRFVSMPGKMASRLVGMSREKIEVALKDEVHDILEELHDPKR